ncbi:hypothetical protein L208DRAFT_1236865 [Tricholoma matsutake]|nr:hypothetical protein L208DRAFT_1236865 [Tricholoma matsutake 945]
MDSSNSHLLSTPLDLTHSFTSPAAQPTRTLGVHTIYHKAQAALCPFLTNIQTQEQLDTLVEHIKNAQDHREHIHDPPVIRNKGRPRSARITGPLEGQPCGGGAKGTTNHDANGAIHSGQENCRHQCGLCRQEGHNRSNCPLTQS